MNIIKKNSSVILKTIILRYVSFLPWDATATVTLKGFKYNLDRAMLHRGTPLGVSNETVKEPTVTVHCGKLICICIEKSQEDL